MTTSADEPRTMTRSMHAPDEIATTTRLTRLGRRVDELSSRHLFVIVVIPFFLFFLVTSARSLPNGVDTLTNVLTAWRVGTAGTVYLPDHAVLANEENYGHLSWLVHADGEIVSKYPPGAPLFAAPIAAVWPEQPVLASVSDSGAQVLIPPPEPATIAASLSVALAMGFLAMSFRSLTSGSVALVGVLIAGLGTTAWSVAASSLWQHGPGMMWLAMAGAIMARNHLASGLAYAAAILTRPLNAAIAFGAATYIAIRARSFRSAIRLGAGAAVGLILLILYNWAIFGDPSISGGYSAGFSERMVSNDVVGYLRNVFLALFSARRGLLVYSPFLIVLIPGLAAAWKAAPTGVRGAAIGAALYLAVQYKANRYSGGGGFAAYRYPLEPLTAAAPLLLLAYTQWVAHRPLAVRAFAATAAISIIGQIAFVVVM